MNELLGRRRARRGVVKRKLTKSEQMARVRSRDTQPELLFRRALWHSGCRYRLRSGLPGSPDIVFPSARVAVFIDGCFWHRCPLHYTAPVRNADFWRSKVERNVARDDMANEQLNAAGWAVVRIWEHEILSEIDRVASSVVQVVRERRSVSWPGGRRRREGLRLAGSSSSAR